jgi:hypothetical protein
VVLGGRCATGEEGPIKALSKREQSGVWLLSAECVVVLNEFIVPGMERSLGMTEETVVAGDI